MKQLIISIPFPYTYEVLECKDFLAASNHSSEWIGDIDNWIIREMQCIVDPKGKKHVVALLENSNWEDPKVKAITGEEVFDVVKDYPTLPIITQQQGINGTNPKVRCLTVTRQNGLNILSFDDISGQANEVQTLLYRLCFDKEDGEWINVKNDVTVNPLALRPYGSASEPMPIIGVRKEKDAIVFIYKHDVKLKI